MIVDFAANPTISAPSANQYNLQRACAKGEAEYNSRIVFPSTKRRDRHMTLRGILEIIGIAVVGQLGAAVQGAQKATQEPALSDQVFNNVQALDGNPVDAFLEPLAI